MTEVIQNAVEGTDPLDIPTELDRRGEATQTEFVQVKEDVGGEAEVIA